MVATPWQIIAAIVFWLRKYSIFKKIISIQILNAHKTLLTEKDTYKTVCRRKHGNTTHESKHFDTNETDWKRITDHQPMDNEKNKYLEFRNCILLILYRYIYGLYIQYWDNFTCNSVHNQLINVYLYLDTLN